VRVFGAPDPIDCEWSEAIQRAFVQQQGLESDFQLEFMDLYDKVGRNEQLDLREHFKDADDDSSWLDVAPEDLDNELRRRQEEFDAYDAKTKVSPDVKADQGTADAEVEAIKRELGSLGGNLAEILKKTSSVFGVEGGHKPANTGDVDEDDEDAGSGDDPFFFDGDQEDDVDSDEGNAPEDAEDAGDIGGIHKDMRSYMSALDDELGAFDAETADSDIGLKPTEDKAGTADDATDETNGLDMPLGSHHIRTDIAPVELDSHAMAHLLASYCAETHMDPGPTSLMLRELGLKLPAPPSGGCCLDDMD